MTKRCRIGIDLAENIAEPRQFVDCATLGENLGLDSIWFGDHFLPWTHTGGKSSFIWSLITASLERTTHVWVLGGCLVDEHETYMYELQHFLECLSKGETPREKFSDGCVVNQIMDAAYEASKERK